MKPVYTQRDGKKIRLPDLKYFLFERMEGYRNEQLASIDVPRIARLLEIPRQTIHAALTKNQISVSLARKLHALPNSGFELEELLPYMV